MTFAWYQSLRTVPRELREAGQIFQLRGLLRLTTIELPFAAIALIWNSMMSWAGGWFFLMAAEIFTVGQRDFRLPDWARISARPPAPETCARSATGSPASFC